MAEAKDVEVTFSEPTTSGEIASVPGGKPGEYAPAVEQLVREAVKRGDGRRQQA